ncbi:hypothetical protein GCM10020358_23630 [Amorphoplanes nipponensis]|uniref:Uncharacterized protein n=1 Tax=Actinoplanes nipponensis TaxID=135950 RepID=A0A919JMS7_9ACTN|nr:hypothetical protein [Actinoplanes nipponensis]GIE49644.1 hypothetical protein Ani05nite_31780 [Actinoplanes nipponensis]
MLKIRIHDSHFAKRLVAKIAAVFTLATTVVLIAASPAAAHSEVSETRVSIGAAATTIIGPTMTYNLGELGLGCGSTYKATFSPTWHVSKVTSTSVYIDYMTYQVTPSRSMDLGATGVINGSNSSVWTGNWAQLGITKTVKKAYYLRKTVSFGSRGYIDLYQWFHFSLGNQPGICGDDKNVHFWLRRA